MSWLSGQTYRKVSGTVCVALMLVFALASSANAVNRLQHATGQVAPHQHAMFSELLMDDHAVADDHDADHFHDPIAADTGHDDHHDALEVSTDTGDGADFAAKNAHHHQHGDTGGSLVILGPAQTMPSAPPELRQDIVRGRFLIIVRQTLPERPPRTSHIAI